jgi:hypothetical protein
MIGKYTYDEYSEQAVAGTLPPDFKEWTAANENGWTIAHIAGAYGGLSLLEPDDIATRGLWVLADRKGWTVAHEAISFSELPTDFSQWDLTDMYGRTVAHEAAKFGHLPADFSQWYLADENGWSVAHAAADNGHLPADFKHWNLVDMEGTRVLDLAKEQYAQWKIKSAFDGIVESEQDLSLVI